MRFIIVIQVEDCDDNNTDYDEDRLWSETFIFISYFIFFNKHNQIKNIIFILIRIIGMMTNLKKMFYDVRKDFLLSKTVKLLKIIKFQQKKLQLKI